MTRVGAVHTAEEPPGDEELSFGGDPDREPRLRMWASAHRRLLAAGAAVVVLLGVLGGGGWYLYDQSQKPLAPPEGPWPEQVRFAVSLCDAPAIFVTCPHGVGGDPRTYQRIEAALRADPAVRSLTFLSRYDTYAEYRKWMALSLDGRRTGPEGVGPDDVSPMLYGTLRRPADYPQVAGRVESMAGVAFVSGRPISFWRGKAEVEVTLCGSLPTKVCAGHTPRGVTDDQKRLVLDRLRGIAGVDAVYFEDRAHALRVEENRRPVGSGGRQKLESMNEKFYVKVRDPGAIEVIGHSIKDLPGVDSVSMVASE
jgi:cell division protein FtsX